MSVLKRYNGTNWENVSGCNYINGNTLFEDSTGVSSGTIQLNDNINNYSYIEVFYSSNDPNSASSKKMLSQSTIMTSLEFWYMNGSSTDVYIKITNIDISGTTITFRYSSEIHLFPQQYVELAQANNIRIKKVIGYK